MQLASLVISKCPLQTTELVPQQIIIACTCLCKLQSAFRRQNCWMNTRYCGQYYLFWSAPVSRSTAMRQLVDQAWCPLFRLGLQNLICDFLNGWTAWVMGIAKPAFHKRSASEQQNPPRNRQGSKVIIQLCNRATDSTHRCSDSTAASPRTDRLFRRRPAFRSCLPCPCRPGDRYGEADTVLRKWPPRKLR